MTFPKITIVSFILFLVLAFLVSTLYMRYRESQEELKVSQIQIQYLDSLLNRKNPLGPVDTLLLTGKYGEALRRLRSLQVDTFLDQDDLQNRIIIAQNLFRLRSERDSAEVRYGELLKINDNQIQAISPEVKQPRVENNVSQERVDSLNFALEKSRIQAEQLQKRLQKEEDDDYLTFQSKKGNNVYYVGDVEKGMAQGRGVGLYSSGSRYEGEWQMNQKHGKGKFFWLDGAYYEGNYKNDLRDGFGIYYWPTGDRFEGEWKDDLRNGKGIFYNKEGKVIAQGIWKDDELLEQERR